MAKRKVLLLTGTLVLLFAVLEGVYRARASAKRREFLGDQDQAALVTEAAPSPFYYRMKPQVSGFTNSRGFRDVERSVEKKEGVYRIAIIGDSVSMQGALPFDELYVRRLQRELDATYPSRTEVLNFAVTGYNTFQQAALFEQQVVAFEPDLAVWQFHDNDGQHAIYDASLGGYYHRPISYFASFIANKLDHFFCRVTARRLSRGALTSDQRNLVCRWDEIVSRFRGVAALARARGIQLLVFLYPSWPDGNDWARYGEFGHALHEELVMELESLDVEVIDLLPVFIGLDPEDYRVAPNDPWHPNVKGHELIAETLLPTVRAHLESQQ